MNQSCDFCGSEEISEVTYSDKVPAGRRRLELTGLRKTVCSSCGEDFISSEQLEHNHALFDMALESVSQGVTVGLLLSLRQRWQLTQRKASSLFSAGDSSFAKWESGQLPSGPSALLIQCALQVPGVVEFLARLNNVEIRQEVDLARWESDGHHTGTTPVVRVHRKCVQLRPSATASKRLDYSADVVSLYGEAA
jgi:putative zinc finger/helix-turn-helix YgiT family protein